MVKDITILELPEASEFIKQFHTEDSDIIITGLKHFVQNPEFHLLVNSDGPIKMMLAVEKCREDACMIHLYSTKDVRGKQLKDFIQKCKEWGASNTNYKKAYNFVSKRQKRLRLFMGVLGFDKRVEDDRVICYSTDLEVI